MSKARSISKLTPATSGVVSIAGTAALKVPVGTTAERPSGEVGLVRYNSTTGFTEVYNQNTGWSSIGQLLPVIAGVTPTTYSGESGTTFTINGLNFTNDVAVKFVTNNGTEYTAATVTFVSTTQITATTPQDFTVAQEPLDVKITQASGIAMLLDCIDCGGTPTWTTTSGNIWDNADDISVNTTLVATDPDAGAVISYSATNLPTGVVVNSSSGLVSGVPPSITASTTYNFTAIATDNAGNTSSRAFNIITRPTIGTANSYPLTGSNYALYTTAWTASSTDLYSLSHTASTFRVPANIYAIRVLVWGGGACGYAGTQGNGGFIDAILRVEPLEYYKVIVAGAGTAPTGFGGSAGNGMGGGAGQDGNDVSSAGSGSGFFYAANSSGTTATSTATMFSKGVIVAGGGGGASSGKTGGSGGSGTPTALTVSSVIGLGQAGGRGTGIGGGGGKYDGQGGDAYNSSGSIIVTGNYSGGTFAADGYGSGYGAGSGGGKGAGGCGGGSGSYLGGENPTGDGGRGVNNYGGGYNAAGPGRGGAYNSFGGNGFRFNGIDLAGGGGGSHGGAQGGGGWGGGGGSYYAEAGGAGSSACFGYMSGTTPTMSTWVNPNTVVVSGGYASTLGVPTTAGSGVTAVSGYNGAVLILW